MERRRNQDEIFNRKSENIRKIIIGNVWIDGTVFVFFGIFDTEAAAGRTGDENWDHCGLCDRLLSGRIFGRKAFEKQKIFVGNVRGNLLYHRDGCDHTGMQRQR